MSEFIKIPFDKDEALVLLEWISKYNNGSQETKLAPEEEYVLFALECELEKNINEVFSPNYESIVKQARMNIISQDFK